MADAIFWAQATFTTHAVMLAILAVFVWAMGSLIRDRIDRWRYQTGKRR